MTTSAPPVTPERAAAAPTRTGVLIGVLLAGAFVMILNETVMGVALPAVMEEFDITASAGQWLTTAFMLTMAVVIPMTGFVLQRWSARTIFVAALVAFSVGTLAAAVATDFSMLVGARVAQAAGTAVMLPLLTTTILTLIPAERRGRTMGLVAIVIAVAPALGPSFSGLLITVAGWRTVFYGVLPIALLVLVVGAVLVRGGAARELPGRFDVLSAALSALAFGGLVYGLGSIGEAADGHEGVSPVLLIAVGLVLLGLFVWRQVVLQRSDEALLDLRVFRSRDFTVGVVLLAVAVCSLFGALILLPIFLQNVLGLTPLQAGLVVLPGGIIMGVAAPVVGAFYDKVGARPLVIPGLSIVAVALGLLAFLTQTTPTWYVVMTHVVLCLGLAMTMTPLMTGALGSLPVHLYPHGSAVVSTLQQLAGAVGTAVFVTVMTVGATAAVEDGLDLVSARAHGIHAAFVVGAVCSVVAVLGSFLVRGRVSAAVDA